MKVKTKTSKDLKKEVIYEVPCTNCTRIYYIGETGRNPRTRLKEHKYAVKRNDDSNSIAVHAQRSGHRVDWETAKVRAMEDHSEKEGVRSYSHPRKQIYQQLRRGTNPESNLETSPQDTTPSGTIRNHGLPIMLNSSFFLTFSIFHYTIISNYS